MTKHESLASALAAAQAEFPAILKTKTVRVQTKTGGSYTFDYAPLEAIIDAVRKPLSDHGLAIAQPLTHLDGRPALRTILMHESGGSIEDVTPVLVSGTMQEQGSGITYMRRYTLTSMLGLASEDDDDGNHAAGHGATPQPKPEPKPGKPAFDPPAGGVLATEPQKKKLRVVAQKLVEDGVLTKQQIAELVGKQVTVDENGEERLGPVFNALTKAEASALIEKMEQAEKAVEAAQDAVTGDSDSDIPF